LILLFIITLLIGCNKENNLLKFSRSISFELPFYPDYTHSGVVFNKEKNRTEFYLANISESNLLLFFNIEGDCIDTLNLSKLRTELSYITKGVVIHDKQYLGIGDKGESLIIDSLGSIVKRFNINSFFQPLTDSINYQYIYANANTTNQSSKVLIYPMWTSTKVLPYKDSIVKIAHTDYKRYLEIAKKYTKKSPLAFQINIDESNNISSKTIFDNYNSQTVKENEFLFGYFKPSYGFSKNMVLVVNKFHDSLWVVNDESKIESFHIPLNSSNNSDFLKHSTIINLDDSILKYEIGSYLDSIENRMLNNAYFERVHYLKSKNIYLLVLRDPLEPEKGDDLILDFGFARKNIIMLDSNFNVLSETIFKKGKYSPLSFLTEDGFFFSSDNPNNNNYDPNIYTFDLYKFK
jgi:hypothetical protein